MKFKIGDKVKIVEDCSDISVQEKNGGLGMEGEIIKVYPTYVIVQSMQFTSLLKRWSFYNERLELCDKVTIVPIAAIAHVNHCPRCNGKITEREGQEPFTGEVYKFLKCNICGWC